jgi:hypothetical protein
MTENINNITLGDAVRLKNDIEKSIKFSGYTVREIEALEVLNEEQLAALNAEIAHIKQVWWFFPDWMMAVGSVVAFFSAFLVEGHTERVVSMVVAFYCVAQIRYRHGVYYGYVRGYEEGHLQGVHRVLGITQDESREISELANQIEADERVIAKLDKNRK